MVGEQATSNPEEPEPGLPSGGHGRTIDPATHPTKPTGPPPAPTTPYRHPLGERLYRKWLTFPDPPARPPPESDN